MMQMAETFLVKCLKPTIDLETFDVLRLAVFNGIMLSKWTSPQSTQENTKRIFSITVVDTSPV